MKYDKLQKTKAETAGFTLVEIVAVLVLLGILAAVAVPKFFDLSSDAEKKAAEAALMEAQVRINARYSKHIYLGLSCEDAVKTVSQLSLISDSSENNATDENSGMFNGALIASDSAISADGTQVKVTPRGSNKTFTFDDLKMKLYVPKCDEDDDNNSGGGSSSGGNGGTGGSTGGSSGGSGSGESGGEDSGTTGNCPGSSTDGSSKNCDECQLSGLDDEYLSTLRPFVWNVPLEDGVWTTLNAGVNAVLIKYDNDYYVSTNTVAVQDPGNNVDPIEYCNKTPGCGERYVIKINPANIITTPCRNCETGTLYKTKNGDVYVYKFPPHDWDETSPEKYSYQWAKIQGYRIPKK